MKFLPVEVLEGLLHGETRRKVQDKHLQNATTVNLNYLLSKTCDIVTQYNKNSSKQAVTLHTSVQQLLTAVRYVANSTPASQGVLLAVRLLLGAKMQTASGVRGRTAWRTSVLSCDALAPGVDMKPKETLPSGILTNPSARERRWESPTTNTN